MRTIADFVMIPVVTLALTGCMAYPKSMPEGEYEQESKSVDDAGTERKEKTKVDVYRDDDGNKKAVVEKETSTDPKGLMNKSTTKTREKIE